MDLASKRSYVDWNLLASGMTIALVTMIHLRVNRPS